MTNDKLTRIAVTLGDPAGIGPEVVLKALADRTLVADCPISIVGSRSVLTQTYTQLRSQGQMVAEPDEFEILEVEIGGDRFIPGIGNTQSGAASFAYLETAIARTLAGEFQGIVTGPIAKSLWKLAGHEYPGQTELLAQRAGVEKFGMLFVARSPHTRWTLRTLLATTHIPLAEVASTLTPELLTRKLDLLVACLQQDFGIEHPRIAIAGLNPHSGEDGQLGREEKDGLMPWLVAERERRPDVQLEGLIPPDTMWVKPGQAWYIGNSQAHDGYLALYHDQGLIPVKLMAFDRAVNTTIGLPFIRTSPDHGTAFDIAGLGIADASSMKAAISLAVELAKLRTIA
jgi:4-hydroxythreonine-4-phosphate dehydrogenase